MEFTPSLSSLTPNSSRDHSCSKLLNESTSKMPRNRKEIIKDEGPGVPIVPLECFQRALLPETDISDAQMEKIIVQMRSSHWLEKSKCWKKFKLDPKEQKESENNVFAVLKGDVMNPILATAKKIVPTLTALSTYESNPTKAAKLSGSFNDAHVSSANVLNSRHSRGYPDEWAESNKSALPFDVTALREFKKWIHYKKTTTFVPNYLHDIESVFMDCVFLTNCNIAY